MTTYRVDIMESERGWGIRLEGKEYFQGKNALEKAKAFVSDYNGKEVERNNKIYGENHPAPDVYWFADDPRLVPDEQAPKKKKTKK
jgi:hypothetical protein